MAVLQQAHYPSSYSNQPGLPVFRVFTATLPNQVRAAAKISVGRGGGAPREFYCQPLHLELSTNYNSEGI